MNSNLRIKKIHEIVKTQNENLLGQYTSLKDLNDRGFQITYKIPLSLLRFYEDNGRIKLAVEKLKKSKKSKLDFSSDEGQVLISKLLWESSLEKNESLLQNIKNNGQSEPGLITNDGIIIDGNRRYMALLKLNNSSKKQCYFTASFINDKNANSIGLIPSPPEKKRKVNIESTSLADFSKDQKNFFDAFINVKFSLMSDMFSINKDTNKTLRFGDFKLKNQINELKKEKNNNYELDNYNNSTLYTFDNLDEFKIYKLGHYFFNSNEASAALTNDESISTPIPAEKIKLDGVFIDLTNISQIYFERDSEAKELPLSTINLIDNPNGMVAIKAEERHMLKIVNNMDEDYEKSPWENYLNNQGFFIKAVFRPNPFKEVTIGYQKILIYIFSKMENNNEILVAPVGSYFENWKYPLHELSKIIKGGKNKSKFSVDTETFYSYSQLSALSEIEAFPSLFDDFTKVKLKDIAISIKKVGQSSQYEKAYIKSTEIISNNHNPQKVGQLLRHISEDSLIGTNLENSFVISPGKYRGFNNKESLSLNLAESIDFETPIVTTFFQAIVEIFRNYRNNLPDKKYSNFGAFSIYEVILPNSLKSDYLAIFMNSLLGRIVASSAHRWALVNKKSNSRVPTFTKQSIGEMTLVFPSLEIQDQIIDAHRKIHQLKSSINEYDKTLHIDPSLIISETIDNINEMLNLVGKLTDEERVKIMIKQVEGDKNEFKQTWRLPMAELQEWQNFTEESNKIKFVVMKVISSYLNANGGELLIGYSEVSHQIEGLEEEFNYFDPGEDIKTQKDHFNTKFNHALTSTFEDYFLKFIRFRFVTNDNKIVYFISCKKADRPCYIKGNKAKKVLGNEFYRRNGDSSDPLEGEELVEYIFNQWPDYRK
jgi:hypothetical protein